MKMKMYLHEQRRTVENTSREDNDWTMNIEPDNDHLTTSPSWRPSLSSVRHQYRQPYLFLISYWPIPYHALNPTYAVSCHTQHSMQLCRTGEWRQNSRGLCVPLAIVAQSNPVHGKDTVYHPRMRKADESVMGIEGT